MQGRQRAVLSIAGFDPSAGAGVLADIKVFEQLGIYGCGITTSITYQNDIHFEGLSWLPFSEIEKQFTVLSQRFEFDYVKIGLIESLARLEEVISLLKKHNEHVKIIWDPIIRASAGFSFHKDIDSKRVKELLKQLYLITPNREEILQLTEANNAEDAAAELSAYCNVLQKGGHAEGAEAVDLLYASDNCIPFSTERIQAAKHGSGCVLSAAITALLDKGLRVEESCRQAKEYTKAFLLSAEGLTGFHSHIKITTDAIA